MRRHGTTPPSAARRSIAETRGHMQSSSRSSSSMDDLAALLDGPRARGAFLLRCLLDPPWSVRLEDEAPLSLTAVVRGHLWADAG